MTRLTKSDLVTRIAQQLSMRPDAVQNVLDETMRQIIAAVGGGDSITLNGFGSFKPRHRAARTGRNPRTGEPIAIAASTSIGFTASRQAGV